MPEASAVRSTGSKPLPARASQLSFARPSASTPPAAAGARRVAMSAATVSVNESPMCSSRSGRASPTCHARTRGGGNEASESGGPPAGWASAARGAVASAASARPSAAARSGP